MKGKAQSAAEKSAPGPKLMFEDHRLKHRYSVIEIATLAAACRGDTPSERIEDAIHLLSAVEWNASTSKAEKLRETIRQNSISRGDWRGTQPENIDAKISVINGARVQWDKWDQILQTAKRDNVTGKIERSSLTQEICKGANGQIKTKEHANRLYREWLQWEQDERAASHGVVVSLPERLAQIESRGKVPLIHDDVIARSIVSGFSDWLEIRPKRESSKIIRSQQGGSKGQIVSSKTRGAARDDGGKFSPR